MLRAFIEDCLRDGVQLVAVVGPDCRRVEDVIDELVVADASDPGRFLTTSSHPDETLDEVKCFAAEWTIDVSPQEGIQEIRLPV